MPSSNGRSPNAKPFNFTPSNFFWRLWELSSHERIWNRVSSCKKKMDSTGVRRPPDVTSCYRCFVKLLWVGSGILHTSVSGFNCSISCQPPEVFHSDLESDEFRCFESKNLPDLTVSFTGSTFGLFGQLLQLQWYILYIPRTALYLFHILRTAFCITIATFCLCLLFIIILFIIHLFIIILFFFKFPLPIKR